MVLLVRIISLVETPHNVDSFKLFGPAVLGFCGLAAYWKQLVDLPRGESRNAGAVERAPKNTDKRLLSRDDPTLRPRQCTRSDVYRTEQPWIRGPTTPLS